MLQNAVRGARVNAWRSQNSQVLHREVARPVCHPTVDPLQDVQADEVSIKNCTAGRLLSNCKIASMVLMYLPHFCQGVLDEFLHLSHITTKAHSIDKQIKDECVCVGRSVSI
jgi:hypothetical protein